jgi:hypothetical protein
MVSTADISFSNIYPTIRRAIALEVIIIWIGIAIMSVGVIKPMNWWENSSVTG